LFPHQHLAFCIIASPAAQGLGQAGRNRGIQHVQFQYTITQEPIAAAIRSVKSQRITATETTDQ
jgi:hypothetical protein